MLFRCLLCVLFLFSIAPSIEVYGEENKAEDADKNDGKEGRRGRRRRGKSEDKDKDKSKEEGKGDKKKDKDGKKNGGKGAKEEKSDDTKDDKKKEPVLKADKPTQDALKKLGWDTMVGSWEKVKGQPYRFKTTDGVLTCDALDGVAKLGVVGDESDVSILFRFDKSERGAATIVNRESGAISQDDDWWQKGFGVHLVGKKARCYGATGLYARGDVTEELDPVLTSREKSIPISGRHFIQVSLMKNDLRVTVGRKQVFKHNYKLRGIGPIALIVKGDAVVDLLPLQVRKSR